MSKENLIKLFEKIQIDQELKKKYVELMASHFAETEKVMTNKLIELGKTAGLSFSKEDIKNFTDELINKTGSKKEISNGDLDKVSGGNYINQAQSQCILFANMVNQQAKYANIAAQLNE